MIEQTSLRATHSSLIRGLRLAGVNNRGGDWEGVLLELGGDLQPVGISFLGHSSIDYQATGTIEWEGTHPRIYSEGGGHASHSGGGGIAARWCAAPPCVIDARNPGTFVRQEAWTRGLVQWPDGKRGQSGGLVSVGEELRPAPGQEFVQYSGLWGSPGLVFSFSGYWGRAFNETGARGQGASLFITAWCDGMAVAPRGSEWFRECHPSAQTR